MVFRYSPFVVVVLLAISFYISFRHTSSWYDETAHATNDKEPLTWSEKNKNSTMDRPGFPDIPKQPYAPAETKIMQCPSNYIVRLDSHNFTQTGATPSKNNRTDYNIVIVTPFADKTKRLKKFFQLLCSLTYPHERISVAIGQDAGASQEGEWAGVDDVMKALYPSFRDVTLYHLETKISNISHSLRQDVDVQPKRRMHMALSRNELLFRAVKDHHDWVIWLDVDLEYIPPNLVQLLLSPNEVIVTPACVQYRPFETYDRNIWRETPSSLQYVEKMRKSMGDGFVMIERKGSLRKRLVDIRDEGKVVSVDGVGGCCLLVNTNCHRQGLNYPSYAFQSHVETEGFAKMASKMGYPIFGLPYVQVFHDMVGIHD